MGADRARGPSSSGLHGVEVGDGVLKVRSDADPVSIRDSVTLYGRTISARHKVVLREQTRLAAELLSVKEALGCRDIEVKVSPERAMQALASLAREIDQGWLGDYRGHNGAMLSEVALVIDHRFSIDISKCSLSLPWRLPEGSLRTYIETEGAIATVTDGAAEHRHLAGKAAAAARELEGLLGCGSVVYHRGLSPQQCLDACEMLVEASMELSQSLDWSQVESFKVSTHFDLHSISSGLYGAGGGIELSVPHTMQRDDITAWIQTLKEEQGEEQGAGTPAGQRRGAGGSGKRRRRKRGRK